MLRFKVALLLVVLLLCGFAYAQNDTAYFWAGGYFDSLYQWRDTIFAGPDQWLDIPIYFKGSPNVWTVDLCYPLGALMEIIDSLSTAGCICELGEITGNVWLSSFFNYNDDEGGDYPNPEGYHSLSFIGFNFDLSGTSPTTGVPLHSEIPIRILSFRVHTSANLDTSQYTIENVFSGGMDPIQGPANTSDTLGNNMYIVSQRFANFCTSSRKQYLPGDANMAVITIWPPTVIGSDVTFLVNYIRGINPPCLLGGFYCSADANGDCIIIGSDVTRMVAYFRGLNQLTYCPGYKTAWPTRADLPVQMPVNWPACESAKSAVLTKATTDGK